MNSGYSKHTFSRDMVMELHAALQCNPSSDASALEVALYSDCFSGIKTKEDVIFCLQLLERVKSLNAKSGEEAWGTLIQVAVLSNLGFAARNK